MPARVEPLVPENIYHLFNRGVNKQQIFFSDRNYDFFIYKMQEHFKQKSDVLAFCLMPNHFHILVRVLSNDFVPNGIQKLMISYAKAINVAQNRVGPLFQGRFQNKLIGNDEQFLDCLRYIHLNPVKDGLVSAPQKWKYSSYQYYLQKSQHSFVDTKAGLQFFDDIDAFKAFTEFGIDDYESHYFSD